MHPDAPGQPLGEVFLDARGNGRAMRLTWHHQDDVVVLSLWRECTCAGTFRLAKEDVGEFIDALVDGLRDAPGVQLPSPPGLSRQAATAQGVRTTYASDAPTQTLPPVEATPSFVDWAFERSDAGHPTAS